MLYDGSSSAEEFVRLGEGFCQQILIPRGKLLPESAILDVGCGNGAVARALTRFLSSSGRYDGVDVNGQSIAWLQARYRGYPNFCFHHADVYNGLYNPKGRSEPGHYKLPFNAGSFDVVLLKSVFTHMLPADVPNYLNEVSRVLKDGARAVMTFFLLNDESRRLLEDGKEQIAIRHEYGGDRSCRVLKPETPEFAVAHDEQRIRRFCTEAGFSVVEIAFGTWCGRLSSLGLQDLVVTLRN